MSADQNIAGSAQAQLSGFVVERRTARAGARALAMGSEAAATATAVAEAAAQQQDQQDHDEQDGEHEPGTGLSIGSLAATRTGRSVGEPLRRLA